jgi:copper(I)-binding protein
MTTLTCLSLSQPLRRLSLGLVLFTALWAASFGASAHGTRAGDLLLDHAYSTPSTPNQADGAAYLRGIKNSGAQVDRLLSASTPVAAAVELQSLKKHGNDLHAEVVSSIVLPPKTTTLLRHTGDFQLLLRGLKQALKDGDRFDLTLNFARAGSQTVKVWVQTPRAQAQPHQSH